MIDESLKKSKTIQDNDPDEFDRKFNEASETLKNIVELRWDTAPMCVHIIYEVKRKIPESIAEEFLLQGIKYYCKDCPYFIKGKNNRSRSLGCRYAFSGVCTDFTPACEFFLEKIKNGELQAKTQAALPDLSK